MPVYNIAPLASGKTYGFVSALTASCCALTLLAPWFTKNKWTVTSVEKDPAYQSKDIDFLVKTPLESCTLEVKSDSYPAKNLFAETVSNTTKKSSGWLYVCEADYLAYVYVASRTLYLFRTKELRDFVDQNKDEFRLVSTSTSSETGKHYYKTEGLLVPLSMIEKSVPHCKEVL